MLSLVELEKSFITSGPGKVMENRLCLDNFVILDLFVENILNRNRKIGKYT